MENSKRGFVPMTHGTVLSSSQCPSIKVELDKMKDIPYASAIGSIMYAMNYTIPDLAYVMRMVSKLQKNPGESHWRVVRNILKYRQRTKDLFLVYGSMEDSLSVKCYTNASFTTDRDDCKSQSGYVFIINGGAVPWKSSKQSVVA
ncbi:secreted RxLR effector protein 161-like [Lactuca sativa]|uniref:secreted RxLR effector protein 161-like n=1 Tax=Lactuca sativa TaxID=4236 RepID=UPI001C690454|nr:secreted RxLR effector protein 161-like [Lactuca sativa]